LYFETKAKRYELARFTNEDYDPIYRLAEVTDPFFKDETFFNSQETLPLDQSHLKQILAENLSWTEFMWGIDSVKVANTDIYIGPILNFMYRGKRNQVTTSSKQKLKQAESGSP